MNIYIIVKRLTVVSLLVISVYQHSGVVICITTVGALFPEIQRFSLVINKLLYNYINPIIYHIRQV
jgi:hypothetical protein